MTLIVNTTPTVYNFSRNKNFVEIETDNITYTANFGGYSFCYFNGLANAIVNDTLKIQWNSGSAYIYTFKASTNIGSLEVAVKGIGQTDYEYISQLANDLMTHSALAAVVEVWAYEVALYVKAKTAGSAMEFSSSTSSVAGIGFHREDAADDIKTLNRPNYSIEIELFGYTGSGWESIVKFNKAPANDKIQFDFAHYIDDFLKYDVASINHFYAEQCTNVIRKFYCTIAEKFGNPPAIQTTVVNPGSIIQSVVDNKHLTIEWFSLKAGFYPELARIVGTNQFSNAPTRFLTNQPRSKKIKRAHREWLYFLFTAGCSGEAKIKFIFSDKFNNQTVVYGLGTGGAVAAKEVWAFPINTRDTGFFYDTPAYVKMVVCVWDVANSVALSENVTYTLDENIYTNEREVYFINSLGGLDTVPFYGDETVKANFTNELFERTRTLNDTDLQGDFEQLYVERNNTGVLNSGWKTAEELLWIEELFLSQLIFMHANKNGLMCKIRIFITNKELVTYQSNSNLKAWVLEYKEASVSELPQITYP